MVTGRYPLMSLTFVDREVRAIRALGVEVITATVRSPEPARLQGAFQIDEATRVLRLLALAKRPGHLFGALLGAMRRPVRLAAAARLAVATCPAGVREMLRQAAYLFEAIVLARHLETRNVFHIHNHLGDSSGTVTMLASVLTGIPYSMTLHVSRCGVEPERYGPRMHRSTGREVLFVGRLDRRKGVHVLLEAVAVLRDRLDTCHLTVVGDGPDRAWMERRVFEGGLKTFVTFAGPLDEAGVAEAMRRADLLVAPSLAEGLPVVIMEALASGVPVVASAVGGVPELVRHGETGLLAPAGDPKGLADAMAKLLACPDLQRSMGEAGRRLVCRDHDARLNAAALLARILTSNCRTPVSLKQNHSANTESNHTVTTIKSVEA